MSSQARMEEKFARTAYRHFFLWGVCSALSVTVSTLVDAMLVGNFVGSDGLAVANIATPVFLFYGLIGLTVGIGANVLIGRNLGAGDVEGANRAFRAQLTLGLLVGAVFLAVVTPLRGAAIRFLGAEGAMIPLAEDYLTIVFLSAPVFVLFHILDTSVNTDSDPKLAAVAAAVVIVTNLTLDLVFLWGLGWGIFGASLSLCIAELLGVAVMLTHFFKKHALLRLGLALPRLGEIRWFLTNGFGVGSAFFFQALVMLVFNTLLLAHGGALGVLHVAIYGVLYTMSTVSFAVFDGAEGALAPVVSIFAGEMDGRSMVTVYRQGLKWVGCCAAGIVLVFLVAAGPIVSFFGLEESALAETVPVFRVFALSISLASFNSLTTDYWQVIGRSGLAVAMSVIRNCGLMLVLGFLLIPRCGVMGVSLSYLLTEILCFLLVVTVSFFRSSKAYVTRQYQVTGRVFERYYPIETESIAQVSADLEAVCEDWEISMKQTFFLNLIAEELILNIIKFGMKDGQEPHYIAIKLLDKEGEYILRIRDNVQTYNPFESPGDEVDNAVLTMIQKKTKSYSYQRKLIFNYLYLII